MAEGFETDVASRPAHWRVGLLHSFRIERDGQLVVPLASRKPDQLLAFLALQPRKAHSRAEICAALWPDRSLQRGRYRLGEVLTVLRRNLRELGAPRDALAVTRAVLQLGPSFTTDVELFEESLIEARRTDDPVTALRALENALGMYGEGLLPTLEAEWVAPERGRLSALRDDAERMLMDTRASIGSGQAEVAVLHAAAVTEPRYRLNVSPSRQAAPARQVSEPAKREVATTEEWLRGTPVESLRRQHVANMVSLAEEAAAHLGGPERALWLDRLEERNGDLLAAIDWSFDAGDGVTAVRLAGALWRYWNQRGRVDEGRRLLEEAINLRLGGTTSADAQALQGAGALAIQAGDLQRAEDRIQSALAIWRLVGDEAGYATCLPNLGVIRHRQGLFAAARAVYDECADRLRELGLDSVLVSVLKNAALIDNEEGDHAHAEALLDERLEIARRLNDPYLVAGTLSDLATVFQFRDEWDQARSLLEEALGLYQSMTDVRGVAFCLRSLGFVAQRLGQIDDAGVLYKRSLDLAGSLGDMRQAGESLRYLASLAEERGDRDEAVAMYQRALMMLRQVGDDVGVAKVRADLAEIGVDVGHGPSPGTETPLAMSDAR